MHTSVDTASALRASFERDGFVVVPSLIDRNDILALRRHAERIVNEAGPPQSNVQTAFDSQGKPKLIKASGLAESDPLFNDLATRPALVDVVENLLGPGSRRFRDVLVVKPARTGGALSYHQDSAYWDVEPKALVSCWIGLGDVSENDSCLSVVPGTHTRDIEHTLLLRGRYELPRPLTRALRRLVSFAGTGDNPQGTGGSPLAWKAKRWILASMTKYVPAIFDLQDFRVPPHALRGEQEVSLPVKAGDAIFFHSLLWHASGPNRSDSTRLAEIISFMGAGARFVGRGHGQFALARRTP